MENTENPQQNPLQDEAHYALREERKRAFQRDENLVEDDFVSQVFEIDDFDPHLDHEEHKLAEEVLKEAYPDAEELWNEQYGDTDLDEESKPF